MDFNSWQLRHLYKWVNSGQIVYVILFLSYLEFGKDSCMIPTPGTTSIYEFKIWRILEANSISNLVRMSSISRSVNSHQKCCCYTCSCCEFCIRSLEKDLQMIPTLRLSYLCLVMPWIFMLPYSTPNLSGIGQHHW